MKKKLLALVLAFTTVFTLAACSAPTGGTSSGDESASAVYESADVQRDASGNPVKPKYDALKCVKLGKYMGVNVTATKYEATKDDVDSYINNILQSKAEYADSDKTQVESGDMVNIDYTGTVDGEEFSGGSATDQDLTIGSGTYIEGFEDQLVGANVGDTVTVNVTFPDDYGVDDLNGKDATFSTTINYIEKTNVPELTDDFVKENLGYDTVDEYKQSISDSIYQDNLSSSLLNWLIENSVVSEVPDSVVDALYQVQYDYYDRLGSMYGYDIDTVLGMFGTDKDGLRDQCKTYASNYLVLQAVMEDASLEITPEYFMQTNGADEDTYNSYVDYYGAGYVHFTVITNCVTDFMKQSAVVYDDSAEVESESETDLSDEFLVTPNEAATEEETTEAAE